MRFFGLLVVLALVAGPAYGNRLTPKAQLRTSAGILNNTGTQGGSVFTFGGLNFALSLYPLPILSLYAGYCFDFDFRGGALPLRGFMGGTRFYFLGEGTQVTREHDTISSTTRARWSFYAGAEVAQREYYVATTDGSGNPTNVTGSSVALNAALGGELRLSNHFDLNVELNNTILSFASTDPRFRVAGFILHVGIGLLF